MQRAMDLETWGHLKRSQLICSACEVNYLRPFHSKSYIEWIQAASDCFRKHLQDVVLHWANPSTTSSSAKSSLFEDGDG